MESHESIKTATEGLSSVRVTPTSIPPALCKHLKGFEMIGEQHEWDDSIQKYKIHRAFRCPMCMTTKLEDTSLTRAWAPPPSPPEPEYVTIQGMKLLKEEFEAHFPNMTVEEAEASLADHTTVVATTKEPTP